MSLTAERGGFNYGQSTAARLAVALLATLAIAALFALVSWIVVNSGAISAPAAKNPFATGGAAPLPSAGVSAVIFAVQAHFYAVLTATLLAIKTDVSGIGALATVGFLYGIFHAVGPGHGKGIISGYIISTRGSMKRGLALSLAAALLQASVAISLVGILALLFNTATNSIIGAANLVEIISFATVAALGTVLVWVKAGELLQSAGGVTTENVIIRATGWYGDACTIIAAGIRPCSGAIILLVYSLSQGLFIAGVCGALAMALGTAITTGTLALLTVFARSVMERSVGSDSSRSAVFFSFVELLAAAFVMVLGLGLLTAQWTGGISQLLD